MGAISSSVRPATRILGLTEKQMANALALTFNKAGSSFQSNVDASLAVRVIQGFVSQDAVVCAQLAQRDITGPKNWLTGVWGYYHLFCKDERNDANHPTRGRTVHAGSPVINSASTISANA